MQDSKLVEVLKTFTKDEFKKLIKFAASPIYSPGRDLVPFINELKPFFPEFSDPSLNEEYIYKKLFKKKYGDPRSYSLMKTLSSDLFKLCKEFFIYLELTRDDTHRNFYLLKQLRERKLYKEFEKEYIPAKKKLDNNTAKGPEDFLNQYFLSHAYTEYSIDTGKSESAINSIIDMRENSLIHSIMNTFRNSELKGTAENYNVSFRYNFADTLIESLDGEKMLSIMKINDDKFYPYAAVNYMGHMMNTFPERQEYFYKMKELVKTYIDHFSRSEKYTLHGCLASYCSVKNSNQFNEEFTREQFEINNSALKLGVYKWSEEDHFQVINFRNMLVTALDLNEVAWIEEFVEKYYSELHPDYRDSMRYYSLANLHFKKGEFEAALENIIKVKYDVFLYKVDVKYLMFKIYYELSYYEESFSLLSTLSQFFTDTKEITGAFKERGISFVKIARELLKRKVSSDVKDIDLLARKIAKIHPYSRVWLLEKIEDIRGK